MKECSSQPRLRRRVRVLLTEGSSLSARQTLYALGYTGAVVDVCDPRPLFCLARYSRFVRACYRCPSFTRDPAGYLQFLKARIQVEAYDVLFPVHDQVFLLARCRDLLAPIIGLAVPEFGSLLRLQSKAEFVRLLLELGLPHPPTELVRTRPEMERACRLPCYIKLSYSTAGCGVWLARSYEDFSRVVDQLQNAGRLAGDSEILVQQPAAGVLSVVQCVFQQGRLVAGHCYMARALGVGGSARARTSVIHAIVLEQVAALGAYLRWHGALTMDYLWDPQTKLPTYIDANPRIGETLNATLSGVNLCAALVQVALDAPLAPLCPGRGGVRTHSVLMTLLAQAQRGESRRALLAELWQAWMQHGLYAGSQDELTRPRDDLLSLIPAAWIAGKLFINRCAADRVVRATVDNYALSEPAARAIEQLGQSGRSSSSSACTSSPAPAVLRTECDHLAGQRIPGAAISQIIPRAGEPWRRP